MSEYEDEEDQDLKLMDLQKEFDKLTIPKKERRKEFWSLYGSLILAIAVILAIGIALTIRLFTGGR